MLENCVLNPTSINPCIVQDDEYHAVSIIALRNLFYIGTYEALEILTDCLVFKGVKPTEIREIYNLLTNADEETKRTIFQQIKKRTNSQASFADYPTILNSYFEKGIISPA